MWKVIEGLSMSQSVCQCVCESCTGHNLLQHCSGEVGSSHLTFLIRGSNESPTIDQCQGATPFCPLNQCAL